MSKLKKKILIIISSVLLTVGVTFLVINLIPLNKIPSTNPWISLDKTLICAHRGGAKLNPENTKKAFDYVIKETTYVDIIEIDVRTTKDGVLVINHDDTLNRMALDKNDSKVSIYENNYEDLLKYNLGKNFKDLNDTSPYASLDILEAKEAGLLLMSFVDFLDEYKFVRDFKFFLEIKDSGQKAIEAVDKVHNLFEKDEYLWWRNRTMIISFDNNVINHTLDNYPNFYVGALGSIIDEEIVLNSLSLDSLSTPRFHCLQTQTSRYITGIKYNLATKEFIEMLHLRNQAVTYWTINDENEMNHLVDIGADIITTDRPDLLESVINKS